MQRREFLKKTAVAAGAVGFMPIAKAPIYRPWEGELFKISLAQWSLARAFFSQERDPLDFAAIAKNEFGIDGIEYVNQFFMDKANDMVYLGELKSRAEGEGVKNVLIMCDREGNLGDPDDANRIQAVENHYKWIEAAAFLGCHSIRVNAASSGTREEQMKLAADGLHRLCEYGDLHGQNVIVENHGGLSSDGEWLVGVMKLVDHPRCGTLPDFGNFFVSREVIYDKYTGVEELMPYAKGVSAKTHEFDEDGNETNTDVLRMMKIVLDAGYRGYVGIEYEGRTLGADDGIRATHNLLKRVREQLADAY